MTYLSHKGSGGKPSRSVFRTCLLVLLGIVAVVLAFTMFAVLLAGLAIYAIYRLVKSLFFGSKKSAAPKSQSAPPAPAPAAQVKESAFATGEVVDVPFEEITPKAPASTQTENK